ncbi:major facilitator superfamily domain-containing protein [Mrakia frigida]|uniref:MFS transporter n=1 Tax=Mrakia frigida TaxID=29902 RepID=UPI003FCBEF13
MPSTQTQQAFELETPTPSSPSTPSSDFPSPPRPVSSLHHIQNLTSTSHLPPHLQPQPSYQSSAAQSRDSSPARSSTFRRADRARRSLLSSTSEDSWIGRLKRWRHGRGRLFCEMGGACLTILLVGINDSATGGNLPSMMVTYNVTYNVISLVFLANTAGYFAASISNSFLLHHYGLKNSLLLAAVCYSAGSLVLTFRPPFPVATIGLALLGLGSGLYDASLTTVVAHYENSTLMSAMYSFFGIGAMISPFVIGSLLFYIFPLVLSLLLAPMHIILFSSYAPPADETSHPHALPLHPIHPNNGTPSSLHPTSFNENASAPAPSSPLAGLSPRARLRATMRFPLVWLGAFLVVLGFSSTDMLGAWLPSYLLEVKGAEEARSRFNLAALWGGIALGRIILTVPSTYLGERIASIGFLTLVMSFLTVLWRVADLAADTAAIVLTGVCLGPITPNIISLTTSRVPPSLKSSVVGILIGLGLIGSALGPLFIGLAAQKTGLEMLPVVLIVVSGISVVGLICVRGKKRED